MDPYNNAEEQWGMRGPAANPYAAPAARVTDETSGDLVKASRGTRLGAVLLDSAVIVVVAIVAAVFVPDIARGSGSSTAAGVVLGVVFLALAGFGIYQIVLLYSNGQTFGKKLLGIKIVRGDGSRASLPRILVLRYLVPSLLGMIPYLGVVFSLLDPLFIFGEEKRCLHDMIADTIVVDV